MSKIVFDLVNRDLHLDRYHMSCNVSVHNKKVVAHLVYHDYYTVNLIGDRRSFTSTKVTWHSPNLVFRI